MKIWVKSQDGRKMLLTGEFIISSYLVDVYEIICEGYGMAKYDSEKRDTCIPVYRVSGCRQNHIHTGNHGGPGI